MNKATLFLLTGAALKFKSSNRLYMYETALHIHTLNGSLHPEPGCLKLMTTQKKKM